MTTPVTTLPRNQLSLKDRLSRLTFVTACKLLGPQGATALAERPERARTEKMAVRPADPERPWTDYTVTNRTSGKSYRVALRGLEAGVSYCSCPDFRTNTLGTCKHILHVLKKVKRRVSPRDLNQPYRRKHLAVVLRYADDVTLRVLPPERMDDEVAKVVKPLEDQAIEDL